MKRLLGVALVVAAVIWVRRTDTAGADPPTTALALGFTLIAAMVTGELLRRFQTSAPDRISAVRASGRSVPRQRDHAADGARAPDGQRHRDGAHRLHRRADAQLRAARLPHGRARAGSSPRPSRSRCSGCSRGLDSVGVAARGAGGRRHREARDGHAVRHRRDQLLADDDGRRDLRHGRAGAPERSRARDRRAGGPRRARAVLGGDAVRAPRSWRGCGRRRERARPARLGDPRRAGVWRSGRRLVRAVSALRGTRGHPGAAVCVRPAQSGRQDAGIRTAAGGDGRRAW